MVYNTFIEYDSAGYESVLARMEGQRSPRLITLDPNFCTAAMGASGMAQKLIRPGYFAGSIPGSNKARILPRTLTTAAIASSGTSLAVKDSQIFIVNDVIKTIAAAGSITIDSSSGGWAAGDTITATIDGSAVTYTVVAGDIGGSLAATNLNVANALLAAIRADYRTKPKVNGSAAAGSGTTAVLSLYSLAINQRPTLAAAETGTNATATASGSSFAAGGVTVGTITAVDPIAKTITIGAGAAVAVAAGVPVGVPESRPEGLGMIQPTQPIDLIRNVNQNYGLFTSASVYGQRLPYWDGELAALFPEITFASLVP
jgi:hypothetical protein